MAPKKAGMLLLAILRTAIGWHFLYEGMYDFQIIEDVNIALAALDGVRDRKRPWRA